MDDFERVVSKWYMEEWNFSISLLKIFIDNTENQIKISVKEFKEKAETVIEYEDTENPHVVTIHKGLDSKTWHLETIFEEHFPNLQRKSVLITLYSYLESTLDKLCIDYGQVNNYILTLKDLQGKGIDRATMYLEKVCGIKNCRATNEWRHVKVVQSIRNLIVHNDGKLIDIHGNFKTKEIEVLKASALLEGTDEVKLKEGYLSYVLVTIDKFLAKLDEEIKKHPTF